MPARGEVKPKPGLYLAVAAGVAIYILYNVVATIAEQRERLDFVCETLTPGLGYDARNDPRVASVRAEACKPTRPFL